MLVWYSGALFGEELKLITTCQEKGLLDKNISPPDIIATILRTFMGPILLFIIGIYMLHLSWLKWGDILVDFGYEPYRAWLFTSGWVFKKEMITVYEIFSSWINSCLFQVFGVSLMTLAIFNMILIAIMVFMIYRIFVFATDRITATAVSATFLACFAFSQYVGMSNYNFVFPYVYNLTYGIFLSFLSIYTYLIYLKRRNALWITIVGVFTGASILTKAEVFIAIFPAILFGISFAVFNGKTKWAHPFKVFTAFFAGFFLPIIIYIFCLSRYVPFDKAISSLFSAYRFVLETPVTSNIFYKRILGTDFPMANILKLFTVASFYVLVFLILYTISYAASRISDKRLKLIFTFGLLGIIYFLTPSIMRYTPWFEVLRPLPLILITIGAYLLISLLNFRDDYQKTHKLLPVLVMTIFSFLLLMKMILNTHIYHYGFALAMPGTLLLIMAFSYQLPVYFEKMFREGFLTRCLSITIIAIALIAHIYFSKRIYTLKTFPVGSGPDTILTFNPKVSVRGPYVQLALNKIKEITKMDDSILVLPGSAMINYLTRRINPSDYISLLPFDLEVLGEDRILRSFIKGRPDYIVFVDDIDVSEFGYGAFGRGYGEKTFQWIRSNYHRVWAIGQEPFVDRGFSISIERRNDK